MQLGMEATYHQHVSAMVQVFREVHRVLKKDGTLWMNYGDTYASSVNGRSAADVKALASDDRTFRDKPFSTVQGVLKAKDLCGIPWRVAFALQDDGWYLRQDIIWHKPNPMPESVRDRCTKAHEYIFLLTKSDRYFFDAKAISEPVAESTVQRLSQPNLENQAGSARVPGKTNGNMKAVGPASWKGYSFSSGKTAEHQQDRTQPDNRRNAHDIADGLRNRRSVWTIATQPFTEAHFATFPPEIPEICIKAGSRPGDMVLDPFGGAGTTGLVADRLGRNAILIELNSEYAAMAKRRIERDAPLLAEVV